MRGVDALCAGLRRKRWPDGDRPEVSIATELTNNRLYLSRDGRCGYALDPDGHLHCLFNNGPRRAVDIAIRHAIDNGAVTIDVFDGQLPLICARHGFVPTGRMRISAEHRDIVFMALCDEPLYDPGSEPYFTSYANAKAASRKLVLKESAHTEWMNECVPALMDMGKDQIVAVAACLNMWRDAWEESHPDGAVDPGPPLPEDKVYARARELLRDFDPSQPRDEYGRWTDTGGSDDHPGEGYSAEAYVKDGVIHTDNVYDAARALHEDRRVELTQPRGVSVLIDRLGEISSDMIAKGEKAPDFNLCKVTIKGTSLFCAESKGIPRVQMPQIQLGQDADFHRYLVDKGYKVTIEQQRAANLRATQNELSGSKVANLAEALREVPNHQANPIFVSNDDYILDGHHRWAAKIGLDAEDNILGNNTDIEIARVDISITKLLEEAEIFTGGAGKLSMSDEAADAGDAVPTSLPSLIGDHDGSPGTFGPATVNVYRRGPIVDSGRGIFFGKDAASVEGYQTSQPVKQYRVSAVNAFIAKDHYDLHEHLFGKPFTEAVADAGATREAVQQVEASIASELRSRGHDALIYTKTKQTGEPEIGVIDTTTAKIEEIKGDGDAVELTRGEGTSDVVYDKVEAALVALPPGHAAKISNTPILFARSPEDFPSYAAAQAGSATVGLFSYENDEPRIYLAETVKAGDFSVPVRQPEQVAVHEVGHALDYASDWQYSANAEFNRATDAAKAQLTDKERNNATYWLNNSRETFAELYSMIYGPKVSDHSYFGMTRERVTEVFADAIPQITKIKRIAVVRRQSKPPKSDVATGWFVDEDGRVYALLNGMPYEVELAGTPLANLRPAPGTYADTDALTTAARAKSLRDFDPSQPRDEHGRWTDGGGGDGGSSSKPSSDVHPRTMTGTTPEAFVSARDQNTRSYFLSSKTTEELKSDRLFLSLDGKSGYALDPDGDLQNLFNNGPRGGGRIALEDAIRKGATTLDAFDGHLPDLYSQHGFVPTGRMKFNDEYAPAGWDYVKYGRPDIIFMAYRGGDRATAADRKGSFKPYDPSDAPYFTDYDLAKAASRRAVMDKGAGATLSRLDRAGAEHRGRGELRQELAASPRGPAESGERLRLDFDPSQPRDEHGRWTDGGGSEGGGGGEAKPVAGYSPGLKTPANGKLEHAKAVKEGWIDKSPVKSIEDATRLGVEAQKALGKVGDDIAKKYNLDFKNPGPKIDPSKGEAKVKKAVDRVLQKAKQREGRIGAVSDLARATFLVDRPEQTDEIIAELSKHFEVSAEPWKVTDALYGDRAANVRLPNGVIAEIQMMHPDMAHAKSPEGGGGHDLYVISRSAAPNGDKPDPVKYTDAVGKMRALYGQTLAGMPASWRATFEAAMKFYAALKAFFGRGGRPG